MIKIKSPDEGPLSLNQPMPEQIEILFPGCEEASGQRLNAFLQAGREFQGCSCLGRNGKRYIVRLNRYIHIDSHRDGCFCKHALL